MFSVCETHCLNTSSQENRTVIVTLPTKVVFSQCVPFYLDLDIDKKKQSSEFLLFLNHAYSNYFGNKKVNILFHKADVHLLACHVPC